MVAMRDGVSLATDVYCPADTGPAHTLVARTPYGKDGSVPAADLAAFLRAGFAVVVQDTRGRFGSEGEFSPFVDECNDGVDTIEWVCEQVWSSGAVAMIGASYYGATQWLAAAAQPTGLKAIVPLITSDSYYEGWMYQGGAFQLGFVLSWTLGHLALADVARRMRLGQAGPERFAQLVSDVNGIADLYSHTPLGTVPGLRDLTPYFFEWLEHPEYDEYWKSTAPRERYSSVTVPSLNIGGWYDCFLGGTLANYAGMRDQGGSHTARQPRLVVGPWAHGQMSGDYPEAGFGLMSNSFVVNTTAMQIDFLNAHMSEEAPSADASPVKLFIMGANAWRDEPDWPLPDTRFTSFYLHSGGRAGSDLEDGVLSEALPEREPEDAYVYDPRDPVPTCGGQTFLPGLLISANAGPRDQRAVESRRDVICFSTAALDEDVEVTGPVALELFIASSAVDTDFTGKLVDVHPDGRAIILTEGILRARYRDSFTEPRLMTPDEVYKIRLDLWATANVFRRGHRIRLEVSSSNFPRFDRNPNTGELPASQSADHFVAALNRIYHDQDHPSRLILPLIRR